MPHCRGSSNTMAYQLQPERAKEAREYTRAYECKNSIWIILSNTVYCCYGAFMYVLSIVNLGNNSIIPHQAVMCIVVKVNEPWIQTFILSHNYLASDRHKLIYLHQLFVSEILGTSCWFQEMFWKLDIKDTVTSGNWRGPCSCNNLMNKQRGHGEHV